VSMRISEAATRVAAAFAAVMIAACQHTTPPAPPLPPQQVESGSTLTLLAPLTFSTGRSELLFQGQRQVSAAALSKTLPYCRLVPQVGASHSLTPGPMKVGKVSYDERESGDTSAMFSVTRIGLTSALNQPGYTLSCGWPEASSSPSFLTTEQIYSAIGGQFTMQLQR
jgi:hypothetical protein